LNNMRFIAIHPCADVDATGTGRCGEGCGGWLHDQDDQTHAMKQGRQSVRDADCHGGS